MTVIAISPWGETVVFDTPRPPGGWVDDEGYPGVWVPEGLGERFVRFEDVLESK